MNFEPSLRLEMHSPAVCRVLSADGLHVGNLKLIGGRWKFKAIGYEESGAVVPGGGPLTARHNAVFASLDVDAVNASLLSEI
jgi:hypothetical protein